MLTGYTSSIYLWCAALLLTLSGCDGSGRVLVPQPDALNRADSVDSRSFTLDLAVAEITSDSQSQSDADVSYIDKDTQPDSLNDSFSCWDPTVCSDGDPCTVDKCEPAVGCVYSPLCSNGETCLEGGDCCQPLKCGQLGAACGTADDLCGGSLSCGGCSEGEKCVDNVCSDGECDFVEVAKIEGLMHEVTRLDSDHIVTQVEGPESGIAVHGLTSGVEAFFSMEALSFDSGPGPGGEEWSLSSRGNVISVVGRTSEELQKVALLLFNGQELSFLESFDLPKECGIYSGAPIHELLPDKRILVECWEGNDQDSASYIRVYDYGALPTVLLVQEWPGAPARGTGTWDNYVYFFTKGSTDKQPLLTTLDVTGNGLSVVAQWALDKAPSPPPGGYRWTIVGGETVVVGILSYLASRSFAAEKWTVLFLDDKLAGFSSVGETLYMSARNNDGEYAIHALDTGTLLASGSPLAIPVKMWLDWADAGGVYLSVEGTSMYRLPLTAKGWEDAETVVSYPGAPEELVLAGTILWSIASPKRIVAHDLRTPSAPIEIGEILTPSVTALLQTGNTLLVSGKTGTIGYNVSIPEKPVQIWIFGDKQYWLQAVWGPTYVLAGPDPDYEPGQPFSLMIYVEEAPAQWTLAATAESPCFYEQGGMALVGEVLAVSCPSETHFYQWHAAEQLIKPLGTYVHETDWGIPEQFAALSSDLMLVRAGHGIEVLRISTWPPELIWNGYYDVTPNYDVNNHRLIEKMLFLPGGTATAAAVFDIDSPPDSEPIAKSPSWARTLDVRKGVAVTGDHLNGRGIHVYDVSGCWGD